MKEIEEERLLIFIAKTERVWLAIKVSDKSHDNMKGEFVKILAFFTIVTTSLFNKEVRLNRVTENGRDSVGKKI